VAKYVLVETRDPFESTDVSAMYELAEGLAGNGNKVSVFLAQNGVLPVRKTSSGARRVTNLASRVTVWADYFSLSERGIGVDELASGVAPASIESLVDLIAEDATKVIWH
jgi:sulfur relay (sulfurtransferase) complex TusBCD TusD component (DsrE family)